MTETSNTSTKTVVRVDDDRDVSTRGRVIGWEDEDRCLVLWGDARYSSDPEQARVEFADELMPVSA